MFSSPSMHGAAAPCQNPPWYVIHANPHEEARLTAHLAAYGIEVYLPRLSVYRARRRQMESEPLFPCYVFARFEPLSEDAQRVKWTPGVRYVVSNEYTPIPVSDEVIRYIRAHEQELAASGGIPRFHAGDTVRVRSGVLQGVDAVFVQPLSASQRSAILVDMLGRLARCEVDTDALERVG